MKYVRNTAYLYKNNPLYISTYLEIHTAHPLILMYKYTVYHMNISRELSANWAGVPNYKICKNMSNTNFSIQKQQRLHNGQIILENPVMTDCDFADFKMRLAEKQNLMCH